MIRCEVCGKIIPKNEVKWKTCCINKMFYFCSQTCFRKWYSEWLKREGTVSTSTWRTRKGMIL